jgi:hypothetical protein
VHLARTLTHLKVHSLATTSERSVTFPRSYGTRPRFQAVLRPCIGVLPNAALTLQFPEMCMNRCLAMTLLATVAGCATNPAPKSAEPVAPPEMSLEEACVVRYSDCRRNQTVALRKDDGSSFQTHFDVNYPPVQNGELISIFPGETLYIEADLTDGHLVNLKAVPELKHPEQTFTFEFQQMDGKPDMTLVARNPMKQMLKYRLGMQTLDDDRLLKSSSCPVIPGGSGYEHWPHPIFQLLITDLHLLDDGAEMVCE